MSRALEPNFDNILSLSRFLALDHLRTKPLSRHHLLPHIQPSLGMWPQRKATKPLPWELLRTWLRGRDNLIRKPGVWGWDKGSPLKADRIGSLELGRYIRHREACRCTPAACASTFSEDLLRDRAGRKHEVAAAARAGGALRVHLQVSLAPAQRLRGLIPQAGLSTRCSPPFHTPLLTIPLSAPLGSQCCSCGSLLRGKNILCT